MNINAITFSNIQSTSFSRGPKNAFYNLCFVFLDPESKLGSHTESIIVEVPLFRLFSMTLTLGESRPVVL